MTAPRAIDTMLNHAAPTRPVLLELSACLTVQRPGVPCAACAEACPGGAIRITDRDVRVTEAACSGCGLCAPACPTGAIAVGGFGSAPIYECARVRRPAEGAQPVPCLAGLTETALRDALRSGDVTLIDRGWCRTCALSRERAEPWSAAVAAVNAELAALGETRRVAVRRDLVAARRAGPEPRPATDNPARRRLFDRIAQGDTMPERRDPLRMVPGKVWTPRTGWRAEQLAELAGDRPLPRALFPALERASTLSGLKGLAQLCPTNALQAVETDDHRMLVFDARACTACGACTASGALAFARNPSGFFEGAETLATETRATCARCRGRFTPREGETACGACARDTDLAALAHRLMRRKTSLTEQP